MGKFLPIGILATVSLTAQAASWQKSLPPISREIAGAGYKRMMMHVHSVYSHDACDGEGLKRGRPNEKCLKRFHAAICRNNYDLVFLTEHRGHLAELPYGDALPITPKDEPIVEGGVRVGLRHTCDGGKKVHVFLGSENQLMPIGLTRHPSPLPGMDLEQTYNSLTPEAADAFRAAGALVGANHMEADDKTIEVLRSIRPDFVEAYNLHANLMWVAKDKKVGRIWKYLSRLAGFIASPFVQADLFFLTFFREDEATLLRWSQLALSHTHGAVAGIDAHENFWKGPMWDGDRPDSYRRLARWFSNWVWLPSNEPTRQEALDAVRARRMMLAFEIFGDPAGFEFSGMTLRGETVAMGQEVRWSETGGGVELHVAGPKSQPSSARLRLLKATEQGWAQVSEGPASEPLSHAIQGPGVYRAEVRITPGHLRRLLPGFRNLIREFPWAMSNPIFVR